MNKKWIITTIKLHGMLIAKTGLTSLYLFLIVTLYQLVLNLILLKGLTLNNLNLNLVNILCVVIGAAFALNATYILDNKEYKIWENKFGLRVWDKEEK